MDRMPHDILPEIVKTLTPNTSRPLRKPPKRWHESWSSASQVYLEVIGLSPTLKGKRKEKKWRMKRPRGRRRRRGRGIRRRRRKKRKTRGRRKRRTRY